MFHGSQLLNLTSIQYRIRVPSILIDSCLKFNISFRSDCYRMSLMSSTNCGGHLPQVPLAPAAPPRPGMHKTLARPARRPDNPEALAQEKAGGSAIGFASPIIGDDELSLQSYSCWWYIIISYHHIINDYLNSYYNQPLLWLSILVTSIISMWFLCDFYVISMAAPYLCHTNTPPVCIPWGSELHHHQPGRADGGQLGSGHDHMDRWQDPESEARGLRDVARLLSGRRARKMWI